MFKETLSSILNVEVYAIIGFFIFFAFFIFVTVHTWRMKKEEVDEFSNLPLNDLGSKAGDGLTESGR